jgi:hypothetical protein
VSGRKAALQSVLLKEKPWLLQALFFSEGNGGGNGPSAATPAGFLRQEDVKKDKVELEAVMVSAAKLVESFLPVEALPHSSALSNTAAATTSALLTATFPSSSSSSSSSTSAADTPATEAEGEGVHHSAAASATAAAVAFWRLVALVLVVVAWPAEVPTPPMMQQQKTEETSSASLRMAIALPSDVSEALQIDSDEFSALCASFLEG